MNCSLCNQLQFCPDFSHFQFLHLIMTRWLVWVLQCASDLLYAVETFFLPVPYLPITPQCRCPIKTWTSILFNTRKYSACQARYLHIVLQCICEVFFVFLCLWQRGRGRPFEYYIQSVHDRNITKLDASNPSGIWISLEWIRPQMSRCFEEREADITRWSQSTTIHNENTKRKASEAARGRCQWDLRLYIQYQKQWDSAIVSWGSLVSVLYLLA